MKYLFFDLEFATTRLGNGKVCEFGYVLTDEKFNVIKRDNLIINPNIRRYEWDKYAVKNILTRSIDEYESKNNFIYSYPTICKLILNSDYIFGHSMDCDVKFLNGDMERYGLPSVDYSFYDVKIIYRILSKAQNDASVNGILDNLGIEPEEGIHDAETDACNTMRALKGIVGQYKLSIPEIIEKCPSAIDKTENFVVESIAKREEKKRKQREYYEQHYLNKKSSIFYGTNGHVFEVRRALEDDLDAIFDTYSYAREQMKLNGNPNQWGDNRPEIKTIVRDFDDNKLYVLTEEESIVGVFSLRKGPDPTYEIIEDGNWLNDDEYVVVHRLASNGKATGIMKAVFAYCEKKYKNVRVDTHEDNKIMLHLLQKRGYTRCGIIYTDNGTKRIAFQKELRKPNASS